MNNFFIFSSFYIFTRKEAGCSGCSKGLVQAFTTAEERIYFLHPRHIQQKSSAL